MSSSCTIIFNFKDQLHVLHQQMDAYPEYVVENLGSLIKNNTLNILLDSNLDFKPRLGYYTSNKAEDSLYEGGRFYLKSFPEDTNLNNILNRFDKYIDIYSWYVYVINGTVVDIYSRLHKKYFEDGEIKYKSVYILIYSYIVEMDPEYTNYFDTDTFMELQNCVEDKLNMEFNDGFFTYSYNSIKNHIYEYVNDYYEKMNIDATDIGAMIEKSLEIKENLFKPYKMIYDIIEKQLKEINYEN